MEIDSGIEKGRKYYAYSNCTFLALIVLVNFVSVKKAVDELGGEGSAKLGTGVAQMILGTIVFFIIAEDETLLNFKEDAAFFYYLMRYAFLFDGLYGIAQVFIAVFKRIDRIKEIASTVQKQNSMVQNAGPAQQNTREYPNTIQSQQCVPMWKRVQDQQNDETKI